jgi:hypothetical protein
MWNEILRLLRRLVPWRQREAVTILPPEPPPKPLPEVVLELLKPVEAEVVDFPEPAPAPQPLEPDGSPDEPMPPRPKRTMPWHGKGSRGPYEMAKLRKSVAEETDTILQRFSELSKAGLPDTGWKHAQVDLLEQLLGNDFMLFNEELKNSMRGGDKYSGIDNANAKELAEALWPIDFGFAGYYDREDDEVPHVAMQWVHSVKAEDFRGRIRMAAPKMVQIIDSRFGDNGMFKVYDHLYGLIGNRWSPLDTGLSREREVSVMKGAYRATRSNRSADFFNKVIVTAMAEQLEARYQWHVAFGAEEGGPRIILPTNPTSALKLFRDRERDRETDRRLALRHWVEKHYRDTDEAGTAYVRDHLRGHTKFVWNDYDCELMVSAYDLEKNELFREEAEKWRAARKHNRFRVRLKKGGLKR